MEGFSPESKSILQVNSPNKAAASDHAQSSIDAQYAKQLGKKLAAIEELRLELGKEGIECPGVVVVGAQSAGKSSVLERLTGIAFPRSENTCTRVPTIVQLQTDASITTPKILVSRDADFHSVEVCNNNSEIQDAILRHTANSVNRRKPILDRPIHIRYSRASGPVMTLIDLPGITHVDTTNENFDVHKVTSAMVRKYVNNENMLVLVVIPANDDFGNSEALRIALDSDKEGVRTIGVVSKCDLVPDKSDILQKIQMTRPNDIKLALGFIAVRNRGPDEESLDVQASEENLFKSHKLLKHLSPQQCGYQALVQKIVNLQSERVSSFIPEARTSVRKRISELRKELMEIGEAPESAGDRRAIFTKEVCSIDNEVGKLIRAEGVWDSSVNIAARSYELAGEFAKRVKQEVPDCLATSFADELKEDLKETMGHSLPNFLSDPVFRDKIEHIFFRGMIELEIDGLIEEAVDLMQNVYEKILEKTDGLSKFPKAAPTLAEEINRQLEDARSRAEDVSRAVVKAEAGQVFTQSSHYMDIIDRTKRAAQSVQQRHVESQIISEMQKKMEFTRTPVLDLAQRPKRSAEDEAFIGNEFISRYANMENTDPVEQAVMDLQLSIHCYADVLMRRLFDVIPMLVRSIIMYDVKSSFPSQMQKVFTDERLADIFAEEANISLRRQSLKLRLEEMMNAQKKLKSVC